MTEHKKPADAALYPKEVRPFGFNFRKPVPEGAGRSGSIKSMSATVGNDIDVYFTDTGSDINDE